MRQVRRSLLQSSLWRDRDVLSDRLRVVDLMCAIGLVYGGPSIDGVISTLSFPARIAAPVPSSVLAT